MRRLAILLLLGTASCSCGDFPSGLPGVDVRIDPYRVDFGATWVGEPVRREVVVRNDGHRDALLRLEAPGPEYVLEPEEVAVAGGGEARAAVVFLTAIAGPRETELALVDGRGKEVASLPVTAEGVAGGLELPAALDFGEVEVEGRTALQIAVVNRAPLPVPAPELRFEGVDAGAFAAVFPLGEIPAGGSAILDLAFAPQRRGPASATLSIAACGACIPVACVLSGTGLDAEVVAIPERLDFGVVSPGSFRTREMRLENRGERSATLVSADGGAPEFRLEAREWPIVLEPGASASVWITFSPEVFGDRESTASFLGERGVLATAVLSGHGGGAVLEVDEELDLGRVPLGWSGFASAVVRNVGEPESTRIVEARIEGTTAWTLYELEGVEVGLRPATLRLAFSAAAVGPADGELRIYTTDPEQPELRVALRAEVFTEPGCRLEARPSSLRFGLVKAGRRHERALRLASVGEGPCLVWDVKMAPGSDPDFTLGAGASPFVEVPVGAAVDLPVAFRPGAVTGAVQRGTVAWRTSNAAVPPGAVPVSGLAADVDLVATPNPVDFLRVPLDRAPYKAFRVENRGPLAATLSGHSLHPGSSSRISVPDAPGYPAPLASGQAVDYRAHYAPDRLGYDRAEVDLAVVGYAEPVVVVVQGEGHDGPCGDYCVPPVPVCPASATVVVNRAVDLPGSATDPQGEAVTCAWRLVSAPEGSSEQPTPPDTCATSFVPDAVGDYVLELTATDELGNEASCRTVLQARPPEGGLWVEMYWEQPSNDIDVHLLHPGGGDPRDYRNWNRYPYDCYYGNKTPQWDDPGREDDPSLDRDITSGTGVENIRIDMPSTSHPYHVGLMWYSRQGGAYTIPVVINIYCWGVPMATSTTTMIRDETGRRPMVYVGEIQVHDDFSCTWTPDGTVIN